MDANEVVMYMEQRNHRDMIFEFLAKSVRQPGKAAHVHPHVEILPFHIRGADVLLVRGADDVHALGSKTLRRAVTGLSLGIVAITFTSCA
jgi:hypothetical protein